MAEDQSKGLLRYSSRDYDSILEEFYSVVPTLSSMWKPESDADPGVVLGKWLASVADMLGMNVDILANELFAPSVSQRKNAEKIFGLIGYHLGWYTTSRTECTFTNASGSDMTLDFGFNGSNFCTLNAYTDITGTSRVITYNILPMTNKYGVSETRSVRDTVASSLDVFALSDPVTLKPGESVTRVAVEGELRNYTVSVAEVKKNNCIISLPSQHIDTTAIWMKTKSNLSSDEFLSTHWIQCESTAEFTTPEPRFAVTYDSYSNAQITVSNYLNQLENYDSNYLVIYWFDTIGVLGCVGEDVLSNLVMAKPNQSVSSESGDIAVSNLSNTVEMPNTYTVTGRSPETAKEAYYNSRNYINTWNSLITLPDYTRFLNREPGVDCGVVIDCQKALEINLAIYNDPSLSDGQKAKMYITNNDFPAGDQVYDWSTVLGLGFNPENPNKYVFAANFQRYTAMCFAIHNDFKNSSYGNGVTSKIQTRNTTNFIRYKPPQMFIDAVKKDFTPLQSMSVDLQFGYARIFTFFIAGQIYTKKPVSKDVGQTILNNVVEALQLYYSPSSRQFGQKPTVLEIVNIIQNADDRVAYFESSSLASSVINWKSCDPEYFNYISFAKYEHQEDDTSLIISPDSLIQ